MGSAATYAMVRAGRTGRCAANALSQSRKSVVAVSNTSIRKISALITKVRVPPPTPAVVYALTEDGRALFRALLPLAAWGGAHLVDARPGPDDEVLASAIFMALQATFDPSRAAGMDDTYEFVIDGVAYTVRVTAGAISTDQGAPPTPEAVVRCSSSELYAIGFGLLTPGEAIRRGALAVEETAAGALERCYSLFGPGRLRASDEQ